MKIESIPILVTAIGGGGYGDQILKALRLAEGNRYRIVGADVQANCPQSKLVDVFITLPLANDPDYMSALFDACDRYKIRALFHGCEAELKRFVVERKHIEEKGVFLPINPTALIDICMDKKATNHQLANLGFDAPKYLCVTSKEELKQIDWFPVVVKPSAGGGGSANVYIVQNTTELIGLADYLGLKTLSNSFMVQEYLGTPEEEYTVGVLHDMDGNYLNSIAVRRLLTGALNIRMAVPNRTGRSELGPILVISSGISHGYVGRFPEVTEQCKIIAKAIGAKGPINIQCRLVNGKVMVFEINPRFSGTTSLRAMVGYNEPDVLIRKHICGEKVKQNLPYDEALILRGLAEYRVDR